MIARLSSLAVALALVAGCGGGTTPGDSGPGIDAFVRPDTGPCATDTDCPGSYCNPGNHACCEPVAGGYEICGDRIDQNCDRHDESCGDQDMDGVQACMTGQDPTSGACDCDDERADVRPGATGVAGAPEICDMADNDCDGRVDESAECCEGCASLGSDRSVRADVCTASGECDCSGEAGVGPCAAGQHCCSSGCTDVMSDHANCGFCEAHCTASSDRCTAGSCACGAGPACDLDAQCTAGACAM
jgi:hypothetical protein